MKVYYLKLKNKGRKLPLFNLYSDALKYFVLLDYYGVSATQVELKKNLFGKPYFYKKGNGQEINLNISHSGNFIIAGVNGYRLGVDIEKVERWPEQLSKDIFTNKELSYIKHSKNENIAKYRLWSLKEAITKYLGIGLLLDTLKIEITCVNKSMYTFKINQIRIDTYGLSFVKNGYVLSFVSNDKKIELKKVNMSFVRNFISERLGDKK